MRTYAPLVAFACIAAGASIGCNRAPSAAQPSASGAVAVIDLDEIARRLGSDKQIAQSITQAKSTLSRQLTELAASYNQQIAERQKALTDAEDKAQDGNVQLAAWQQQASVNLSKQKQQAELDLQRHRAQLVEQFRAQIKPVARRVAASRGLSVIVTKNDSVLFDYSNGADITEAVVDELLASHAPTPAPSSAAVPTPLPPTDATN